MPRSHPTPAKGTSATLAGILEGITTRLFAAIAMSPQQRRMTDCNKQTAGKKGAERKAFMSTCLKG